MKNITYINAGAGSGKTYFLTQTFADHVMHKECTPSEVILTTFSEKAAADIKRNARNRFIANGLIEEAAELDAANIGTVHAIAYKYIKKYWYLLGISAQCDVMDDDNKKAYISLTLGRATEADDIEKFREYAEHMNLTQTMSSRLDYDFWKDAVAEIISKADSMGIADLDESRLKSLKLVDDHFREHHDVIRDCTDRIFKIASRWRRDFEQYKKDNSIIEYNDMENYFLKLLSLKVVQDEIRDSIKYVFVDEFQDSNPKQVQIFDLLSELVRKSYWVGDPKQAIYGFRACDTALVLALTESIRAKEQAGVQGFKTDTLTVSRRSLKPIVDFTNTMFGRVFTELKPEDIELQPTHRTEAPIGTDFIIQHWDGALKADSRGTMKTPNKSTLTDQLASELRRILDGRGRIKEVYDKKDSTKRPIRPSDIAVLCRTNSAINEVAAGLRKYRIPVVIKREADDTKLEIRLVLLMLNYILGIDAELLHCELGKLWGGLSLTDILEKDISDVENAIDDLNEYRRALSGKSISSIVRGLVIRMDLLDKCAQWGNAEERKDNLMALIQSAEEYESNCLALGQNATIEGFITRIQDHGITVDGYDTDGVNVLTYHGSKGLQWPVVILFSLNNDLLNDTHTCKSFLWDVLAVRKDSPNGANLYPGYYLIYTAKQTNHYKTGVPQMKEIAATTDYQNYRNACIMEARRLLYVGVTRARDFLIEMGPKHGKLDFLTHALCDLYPANWEARTEKDWDDGTMQEIWGPGSPKFFYRIIDAEDPPAVTDRTSYEYIPKLTPCTVTDPKRISPSSCKDDTLVESTVAVCLNDNGEPFPQTIIKRGKANDDELGTCIHDIFAVYDPSINRYDMEGIAKNTISRHGLSATLTDPGTIIDSIEVLYTFLENTYGKATAIEHELPFLVRLKNGQMSVGAIDLVWFTSQTDCVLIDFKNLPEAKKSVLNPTDNRFIGNYAPQQKAYKDALVAGGLNVQACIIYLSMQSRVVELKW